MNRRILLAFFLCAASAGAEVVRVDVQSRADILTGRSFGLAGAYEKVAGRVYFAVDPSNPANQIIADISKAPRNAKGQVEFSADVFILKPKQMERGNGAALLEISNRGGKGLLGFYNHARGGNDPSTEEQFGDGFLMKQGFTLVWVGWQGDVPANPSLLHLYAPKAAGISGVVRADFVPTEKSTKQGLSDRNHVPYLVTDPSDPSATMTVRDRVDGPRQKVPRDRWNFSADGASVEMLSGFELNRIYEVVYKSQDPMLIGLGPAAVRDFLSYLKFDSAAAQEPLKITGIRRTISFGVSQSGRFLRTYLYYGFNQDEHNRPAMDGVMAHVAGAGRGSFNHRFAQPSRDGHPFLNFFYPTDIFPFTDLPETDSETGMTDALLARAAATNTLPKIFYTNSSYEYYGRAASLIHTTIDGKADATIPANVRIYQFSGGQHGPAQFPPRKSIGQQLNNPNDYRWSMRALLLAMDRWTAGGPPPPDSVYPKIADHTLTTPEALPFPKIANYSSRAHRAYRADYGPQWKQGIVTIEPPKIGNAFPILVPQVDDDGNDLGGVKMPEVSVPLATYTGWNLFNGQAGPVDEVSSMQGSYIPFPRTKADRMRTGDPRASVEERYHDRAQYMGKVSEAAMALIEKGLLLEQDLGAVLKMSRERWDYATSQK